MTALTATPSCQALTTHHAEIKDVHLRALFAEDPGWAERFSAEGASLFLDYSKNCITDGTLRLLLRLAEECGVTQRRVENPGVVCRGLARAELYVVTLPGNQARIPLANDGATHDVRVVLG